ncbi:autotransporter assembly complex protein TamA [Colwellia ponticola]|nr:autotransporter assembly complex family protein [Colwellia ponticola]
MALSAPLVVVLSEGLPKEIKQNIQAHLGALPDNDSERAAFILMAKKKTLNALNALGYYRASVTSLTSEPRDNNEITLTINVVLNQPTLINKVDVVLAGDALNDSAFTELISDLAIRSGDILHHGAYEKLKIDLASLGLERGYFTNKFTKATIAIHRNLKTADIIIHYDSGPRYQFGEITFNYLGINPSVLKPLVPFKVGDFYQQRLLQNLQNELDETQYFSNVVVRPSTEKSTEANNASILAIDISLKKAKSHQLDLGLGYATDTKENFSLVWKTPAVNNYGHKQETRLSYSKINPTGSFVYSIPLTHPNNDIFQFKALLEENDFADLTSKFTSFQMGRVYLEDEILRQPYVRYLNEKWDVDGAMYDNANYFIPGFTWSDKTWQGSVLDPSNGFRQYYNVEGSYEALNSETSFLRFNARWKYIALVAPKHRVVTRAELGYIITKNNVGAELSPSLRFYAGGDQSIRGFAYQSIGPKTELLHGPNQGDEIVTGGTNMIVASIEYQYYFTNEWRGALFSDGGSVNNTDKLNLAYSVGTGIHYISPIGPIRFALGYPLSEQDKSWRIHFSIGADL